MVTIQYEINGKMIDIEVTEEFAKQFEQIEKEERKQLWKNKKRRDSSLDLMIETGFQIVDLNTNIESNMLNLEEIEELRKAILCLPEEEIYIIKLYYFEGLTLNQIASKHGIQKAGICKHLQRIIKKIQKILIKNGNFCLSHSLISEGC